MLPNDPNCFGHPTKVTFTFADRCLKDKGDVGASSFWTGQPYRDQPAYDIQKWLAHKMRSQREKVRLERAVQRAERKLQEEYDKQMAAQREAAEKRFKSWLKAKGFADQAPVMLHRQLIPVQKVNSAPPSVEWTRAKTARSTRAASRVVMTTPRADSRQQNASKLSQNNNRTTQRPKSASAAINRKRISSTLDIKAPASPTKPCKALCSDDYMKMKHLAGKRYKKLKEQKEEFQCEDQLLRKLQDLEWEEKCIKNKMVFSEKENLDKIKTKALKRRKRKLKFKGDVITVEVEELDDAADVEILFEDADDQYSDIGCIEKEGVDFHIESRETIDLEGVETAVNSSKTLTLPPSPPPPVLHPTPSLNQQVLCQEDMSQSKTPTTTPRPVAPPTTPRPATAEPPRSATAEPPRTRTVEPSQPVTVEPLRPATAEPPRTPTAEPPRPATAESPKVSSTEPNQPTSPKVVEPQKPRPKTASSESDKSRRQKAKKLESETKTNSEKLKSELKTASGHNSVSAPNDTLAIDIPKITSNETNRLKEKNISDDLKSEKTEKVSDPRDKAPDGSHKPPSVVIDTTEKTKIVADTSPDTQEQKIEVFITEKIRDEKTEDTAEKTDNIIEKTDNISEKANNVSEKTDIIAEKAENVAEKNGSILEIQRHKTDVEVEKADVVKERKPTDLQTYKPTDLQTYKPTDCRAESEYSGLTSDNSERNQPITGLYSSHVTSDNIEEQEAIKIASDKFFD